MLKKILFGGMIAIFALTLLPLPSSATSTALQPGTLIKGSNASVYYYGADGKRYVFPTENTYKTWFVTFNIVVAISSDLMGEIPIGGNVTYKPGVKLVKITTDPKVYYVDKEGTLRWVTSEDLAKNLWGAYWYKNIDDVPDPFFVNYKIGEPLENPEVTSIPATYSINQDKLISNEPDPSTNEISNITLSGSVSGTTANLNWTTTSVAADQGFKVVWSNQPDPVYPGNEYHYLSDPNVRSDIWEGLAGGTYYFRVCQYLGGKCGIYSNNLILKVSGTSTDTGNKTITLSKTVSGSTVSLSWIPSFTSSMGFKIVKAEHVNPIYPGDDYHYLSESGARSDKWEGLSAGTYHFRVCEYLGSKCGVYSNDVSVTIENVAVIPDLMLDNAIVSGNSVTLSWSLDFVSENGFKIVKAEHTNPIYPGDDYQYLSDPAARNYTWQNLPAGTWHFRVCEYLGGSCGLYSNEKTVTITSNSTPDNSNGTISLSGNINSGVVYLNWVLSNMTSSLGFKVVKAEHINPIYPGDDYHYYTDPNLRTDTWEDLSTGTYHFRVCEYLGGSCGKYSNDLNLTVQ